MIAKHNIIFEDSDIAYLCLLVYDKYLSIKIGEKLFMSLVIIPLIVYYKVDAWSLIYYAFKDGLLS